MVLKEGESLISNERHGLSEASLKRRIRHIAMEIRMAQVVYLDEYPSDPKTREFNPESLPGHLRVALGFNFEDRRSNMMGLAFMTIAEDSENTTERRRDIIIDLKGGKSGVSEYDAKRDTPLHQTVDYYKRALKDRGNIRPIKSEDIYEAELIIEDLKLPWNLLK